MPAFGAALSIRTVTVTPAETPVHEVCPGEKGTSTPAGSIGPRSARVDPPRALERRGAGRLVGVAGGRLVVTVVVGCEDVAGEEARGRPVDDVVGAGGGSGTDVVVVSGASAARPSALSPATRTLPATGVSPPSTPAAAKTPPARTTATNAPTKGANAENRVGRMVRSSAVHVPHLRVFPPGGR